MAPPRYGATILTIERKRFARTGRPARSRHTVVCSGSANRRARCTQDHHILIAHIDSARTLFKLVGHTALVTAAQFRPLEPKQLISVSTMPPMHADGSC